MSKALLIIPTSCLRSTGRRVIGSPCSLRAACHHLVAASAAQKGCSASSQRQGCSSQGKLWRSGGDCCHGRKPCRKQAAARVRLRGRASAEFPELKAGRSLVEVFLVWKTSTGNLERRFRTYSEVHTVQRSSLLDTTAETMMLADQAPPSGRLRGASQTATDTNGHKKTDYLAELHFWHGNLHPVTRERRAKCKQRRDAGVSRTPVAASAAPTTEAAFGRKREAAIADAVSASPRKRAHGARDELGPAGW